jgi:uncharacterized alkaline shock family protein YloU
VDQVHVEEKSAIHEAGDVHFNEGRFEGGNIHISDDVMVELAKKTMLGIPHIQLANMGVASKFGIGRKGGDSIRVSSTEEGKIPTATADVYILVKYGQRIPDVAWDVQEKIKSSLERYTGYTVTAVNVNVQGIYLEEPSITDEDSKEAGKEPDGSAGTAGPSEE